MNSGFNPLVSDQMAMMDALNTKGQASLEYFNIYLLIPKKVHTDPFSAL